MRGNVVSPQHEVRVNRNGSIFVTQQESSADSPSVCDPPEGLGWAATPVPSPPTSTPFALSRTPSPVQRRNRTAPDENDLPPHEEGHIPDALARAIERTSPINPLAPRDHLADAGRVGLRVVDAARELNRASPALAHAHRVGHVDEYEREWRESQRRVDYANPEQGFDAGDGATGIALPSRDVNPAAPPDGIVPIPLLGNVSPRSPEAPWPPVASLRATPPHLNTPPHILIGSLRKNALLATSSEAFAKTHSLPVQQQHKVTAPCFYFFNVCMTYFFAII